jgi:hypothetical protein
MKALREFLRDEALIVSAVCWSATVLVGVLYGLSRIGVFG